MTRSHSTVHEDFDIEAAIAANRLSSAREEAQRQAAIWWRQNWPNKSASGPEFLSYVRLNGIRGASISSPREAALVEQLRREMAIYDLCQSTGPTDVLVPIVGPGNTDAVSRYGGAPNMPSEQSWPVSKSGDPMTFLAQICFADSRDLVGSTPGELLLIFNAPHVGKKGKRYYYGTCYAGPEWAFRWSGLEAQAMPSSPDRPLLTERTIAHFQRWRALEFDYCDTYDLLLTYEPVLNPTAEKGASEFFADPHALGPLLGFRIGGSPCGVQDTPEFDRFLCEFDGIQFSASKHGLSVTSEGDDDMYQFMIGDAGKLYVGFDGRGSLVSEEQCY